MARFITAPVKIHPRRLVTASPVTVDGRCDKGRQKRVGMTSHAGRKRLMFARAVRVPAKTDSEDRAAVNLRHFVAGGFIWQSLVNRPEIQTALPLTRSSLGRILG